MAEEKQFAIEFRQQMGQTIVLPTSVCSHLEYLSESHKGLHLS